jgi:hypothetical protein
MVFLDVKLRTPLPGAPELTARPPQAPLYKCVSVVQ